MNAKKKKSLLYIYIYFSFTASVHVLFEDGLLNGGNS